MTSVFDYTTLSVSFDRSNRSCTAHLLESAATNPIKLCNELERFFDWLTSKVEIYSVVIENHLPSLELINKNILKQQDENELLNHLKTIQRIAYGQLVLPQTISWNCSGSLDQFAFELMAGADFRIVSSNVKVSFDSLLKGIASLSGSSLYSALIGINEYRSLVMSSDTLNATQLISKSIANFTYNDIKFTAHLKRINEQSPISRIQFKRLINDPIIKNIDEIMASEISFSKAALALGDWKNWAYSQSFLNPRDIGKSLRSIPTMQEYKASLS